MLQKFSNTILLFKALKNYYMFTIVIMGAKTGFGRWFMMFAHYLNLVKYDAISSFAFSLECY